MTNKTNEEALKDAECALNEAQETIEALTEINEDLKKNMKYFVSIQYHMGIVMGRMPETSGVFDTKEQVNNWINSLKKDPSITIENVVAIYGEQVPVVMTQKQIQSVGFKKEFIGI